jgi:hypothetical protein
MASLGKKILSAFMEVTEKEKERTADAGSGAETPPDAIVRPGAEVRSEAGRSAGADNRYAEYFDKLLSEANIPGPDYYEFARMVAAMQLIPDESARYHAAYAGLQVQGLNKDKLLSTAAEYLRVLTADSDHFQKTLEAALQDKVRGKET